MKTQTLRQWLLDRHESDGSQLDEIRRTTLGARSDATVTGQVAKPGAVAMSRPVYQQMSNGSYTVTGFTAPLAEAIAAAGGLTNLANSAAITVKRTLPDGTVQSFGPLNLSTKSDADFEVRIGDAVNVPIRLF